MKEEKIKNILRHCQTMAILADVMDIEMHTDLVDAKFKDPKINNHVRRLKESIAQIKTGLAYLVKPIDREHATYTHAVEMHRLFKYFATTDSRQLADIMDAYEQFDRDNPPTEVIMHPLITES